MSDRRRAWARTLLTRLGRAALTGLTAMGSGWCGGYAVLATSRQSRQHLDGHEDAEVRAQASRGIAEIEAYLAAVGPTVQRTKEPRRHRRRGESA
jgi:hypothetical protein